MNRATLESLARTWSRHQWLRHGFFGLAAAGATAALVLRLAPAIALFLGLAAGAGTFLVLRRHRPRITARTVAEHLDRLLPELEESALLWLRDPESFSLVERLQLRRINAAWAGRAVPKAAFPPPRTLLSALGCAVASAFLLALAAFTRPSSHLRAPPPDIPVPGTTLGSDPFWLATLEIRPPAYLGRPPRHVQGLSAEVEEGAEVLATLVTASNVIAVERLGAGAPPVSAFAAVGNGRFQFRRHLDETEVFQIAAVNTDGTRVLRPELHVLRVIPDRPPVVRWKSPALPKTTLAPINPLPTLPFQVVASDDHGLGEVRLVWTLAQGSGEGVTFRDEAIPLVPLLEADASGASHGTSINLAELGLKPGDELYVHAIAVDRRTPTPNESRSETRLISVLDPSARSGEPAVWFSGLRRLPQYFRSQRQLILDTEQLLAERASISEARFRERSESIGVDQKLLRLRYGHFLGEEFEPESSGAPREALAMEWAGTLRQTSGEDLRRAAAVGRAIEASHDHDAFASPNAGSASRPPIAAPPMHQHDSPEAATLFDDQVKAALRAILAAMWEAEGFLRSAQPAAALPAEHRALETLKALQQADRLSVRQVGSEPPPLALDERRLRGELDAIPRSASGTLPGSKPNPDAEELSAAIASLAGDLPRPPSPHVADRIDARLVLAARSDPDRYLPALELWRARDRTSTAALPDALRRALGSLLPPVTRAPHRPRNVTPQLGLRYAEALAPTGPPER